MLSRGHGDVVRHKIEVPDRIGDIVTVRDRLGLKDRDHNHRQEVHDGTDHL